MMTRCGKKKGGHLIKHNKDAFVLATAVPAQAVGDVVATAVGLVLGLVASALAGRVTVGQLLPGNGTGCRRHLDGLGGLQLVALGLPQRFVRLLWRSGRSIPDV